MSNYSRREFLGLSAVLAGGWIEFQAGLRTRLPFKPPVRLTWF
jgi:hypothetical protein